MVSHWIIVSVINRYISFVSLPVGHHWFFLETTYSEGYNRGMKVRYIFEVFVVVLITGK